MHEDTEEMVPTMIWLTIGVLIIMANITTRAIEFLTVLKEEYYRKFENGLPTTTIEAAKPKKIALKTLETDRKDRDLFRTFHKEVVRPEHKSPQCQCNLVEEAQNYLNTNSIPFEEMTITCEECGQTHKLPIPKNAHAEGMSNIDIPQRVINGELDYACTSTLSVPSIDQPGCGGCVYTGTCKWTVDSRALQVINRACSAMRFNQLKTLSDAHVRMVISLFSHCFITAELSYGTFDHCLTCKMDPQQGEVKHNEELLTSDEVSEFIEWMLISAAHYLVGDDETLLSRLRRDIQSLTPEDTGRLGNMRVDMLAAMALFELLLPVKFAMFQINQGLHTLCSSNSTVFHQTYSEPEAMIMQPVVLIVVVIDETHFHKTVMQPGKGVCVKGIDKTLPGWLEASGHRSQDLAEDSVAVMIRNWNDGHNEIFSCSPQSEEARKFRASKRGTCISQLPKFNDEVPDDAEDNMSPNQLILSPISLIIEVMFYDVNSTDIDKDLYSWVRNFQQRSNLVGTNLWDSRWRKIMSFELPFIQKYREKFFALKADYEKKHDEVADTNDWCFSPWLQEELTPLKKNRMENEIKNRLTATPSSVIRPVGAWKGRLRSSAAFTFGTPSKSSTEPLSCAMHAINILMVWITGKSILKETNQRFPLTNNIGISFGMLCSVPSVYNNISWSVLPVDSSLQGSSRWKTKLFRDVPLGHYWVQLDLTGSTLIPAEHVCAVHIFSDWKRCNNSSRRIAKIIDNRGNAGYVQKEDVEDLDDMKVGDKIFQLFLGMDHSRLTNIINLKRRQHRDSEYHHAVETERQLSNRRVTRQSKVKAKVATQGEKKVKKKVVKRHKTLEKVLEKYASKL